jgi:hypothetical protein
MLGRFQKDDDGHTYFIPINLMDNFQKSQKKIWLSEFYSDEYYNAVEEFCNKFNEYKMAYFPEYYTVDLQLEDGED